MFFFWKRKPVAEPAAVAPVVDLAPIEDVAPVTPKRRRVNANKTRLMGFDTSDGRDDLFKEDQVKTETARVSFPVGLVMVTKGPGLGSGFPLLSGMSQIGRSDDQSVCLDFGDTAISRSNHAAIVYDPTEHSFLLGQGGKSNVVRLNGKPVVTTNDLTTGDEIEIGETTMRFVAFCSNDFNWETDGQTEGSDEDDLEIA